MLLRFVGLLLVLLFLVLALAEEECVESVRRCLSFSDFGAVVAALALTGDADFFSGERDALRECSESEGEGGASSGSFVFFLVGLKMFGSGIW